MDREDDASKRRSAMVQSQLVARGFTDEVVLDAMRRVPRHRFVPKEWQSRAYSDGPLPIGEGQTISQPYIVALMTQLARPMQDSKILDIGTGSGYQAAVLAEIVDAVYSVEINQELSERAQHLLVNELGYRNIHFRCGDGYEGWPEEAPFDAIVVAAAPNHIPEPLIDQLGIGGRLIVPVGRFSQTLMLIEKREDGTITRRGVAPVAFVPMTGMAEQP